MDQDAFRQLLSSSQASGSSSTSSLVPKFQKPKQNGDKPASKASNASFKPRKVKNTDSKYRDRAAERRVGAQNEYTQIESVLEDFEKRNIGAEDKAAVDAQRAYLGGDSEHTVLVKGLDMALLEQNRARAAQSAGVVDDDTLEEAFLQSSSADIAPVSMPFQPAAGQKRSRADILRELKEKRAAEGGSMPGAENDSRTIAEAKQSGKFKPIGFTPIGAGNEKKKKKKVKPEGEEQEGRKKKKRKVKAETVNPEEPKAPPPTPAQPTASTSLSRPLIPPDEDVDPDMDIFADAGDYKGLDSDEEDEEHGTLDRRKGDAETTADATTSRRSGWFKDETQRDPGPSVSSPTDPSSSIPMPPTTSSGPQNNQDEEEDGEEEEEPQMTRLQPLSSSAIPSIKDLLSMDDTAGKKRKKGGKGKKGKGGASAEGEKEAVAAQKANRDYQRLKSYTEKKQAES